jgi:hypothetical protein
MTENACSLDAEQRALVECQISQTCTMRRWKLHVVNCRSNHLHVVLTASRDPKIVRTQLKAWCTRRLKELEAVRQSHHNRSSAVRPLREKWWAERGSQRFINDATSLECAITYVRDGQVQPRGQ